MCNQRGKKLKKSRAYYKKNKEQYAANYKIYYAEHKEEIAERGRLYREANKKKIKGYRKKNRLKELKRAKVYRTTLKGRAVHVFGRARVRARKFNLDFKIELEWVIKVLKKGKCQMTGLKFTFDPPKKGFQFNPYSPSIDRHDPKKGYYKDNCRLVITAYNLAKNQWNMKHFRKIMRAIVKGFK